METKRLILRPWREEDAQSLFEYAGDPRVGPIAGWPPHTGVENSREIICTVLSAPETYAVCLKEDNIAIGSIGLMIGEKSWLRLPENEGEIGYWIGVPFWGRGLIPEAVRELQRRAFVELRLETLWCGYFIGNERSRRVQEKCGFVYDHTRDEVYCAMLNETRTENVTRLTRQQWLDCFTMRPLEETERDQALDLAWKVFLRYEAPDYAPEGTEEFRRCLHNEQFLAGIAYYGAFYGDALVGLLGIRAKEGHICFFFVDGPYHRLGIGTRLFSRMRQDHPGRITLNSSPYGVPFYRALGFTADGQEKTVNGIRFTPMHMDQDGGSA